MHLIVPDLINFTQNDDCNNDHKQKIGDVTLQKFMKAKNKCVLTPFVDKLIKLFGEYSPLIICDSDTKTTIGKYAKLTEVMERRVIPETAAEYRNSIHYCIPS